jgi:hypothetical protein
MKNVKLELTDENGKYTVEVNETCLTWTEIVDRLVTPILLAAGYIVTNRDIRDAVEENVPDGEY